MAQEVFFVQPLTEFSQSPAARWSNSRPGTVGFLLPPAAAERSVDLYDTVQLIDLGPHQLLLGKGARLVKGPSW